MSDQPRIWRRCHYEAVEMPLDAEKVASARINGQTPPCDHVGPLPPPIPPGKRECRPCVAAGQTWTRLLTCLSCGWVACFDEERGGHARAHYQETDHPVAAAMEPGPAWRWCYVHRRSV